MASATLNHFPPGSTVTVYVKTGDAPEARGKKVASVELGADGAALFTKLDEDTEYWAECDRDPHVVDFFASDPDPAKKRRSSAKKKAPAKKASSAKKSSARKR